MSKIMYYLKKFDFFILPIGIALSLAQYSYWLIHSLVHVDSSASSALFRKPDNSRKAWAGRVLLVAGIGFSLAFGRYVFAILEATDLARVKPIEYYLIVIPIQVNIGCVLGGVIQWKMERRIMRRENKRQQLIADAELRGEKEALLDV